MSSACIQCIACIVNIRIDALPNPKRPAYNKNVVVTLHTHAYTKLNASLLALLWYYTYYDIQR